MLTITHVSGIASIQDLGREGFLALGIGRCGAMDSLSYRLGNALLANDANACALEIALSGLKATFDKPTSFCLTGASVQATLNGQTIHTGYRYFAQAGQVLDLKRITQGMYVYLCVQGGFDFACELGSASTDVKTTLGGLGRVVMAGDLLPYQEGTQLSPMGVPNLYRFENPSLIHIIKSSEHDRIIQGDDSKNDLDKHNYRLSPSSNRMGYRLEGTPLPPHTLEMHSHGVEFGIIQLPPDGKPIVLMADAQTTGGYPKIAAVISADLGKLSQVKLGQDIRFCYVTYDDAVQKMQHYEHTIAQVAKMAKRF